jgi:hypothetical protein
VFNFQQRFRRSTAKAIFALSSIHGGWWVEAGSGDVRVVDPEARESESAGAGQVEAWGLLSFRSRDLLLRPQDRLCLFLSSGLSLKLKPMCFC